MDPYYRSLFQIRTPVLPEFLFVKYKLIRHQPCFISFIFWRNYRNISKSIKINNYFVIDITQLISTYEDVFICQGYEHWDEIRVQLILFADWDYFQLSQSYTSRVRSGWKLASGLFCLPFSFKNRQSSSHPSNYRFIFLVPIFSLG